MLRRLAARLMPWQIDVAALLLMAALGAIVYFVEIGPLSKHYRDRNLRAAQLAEQESRHNDLAATLQRTREAAANVERSLAARNLPLEPRSRLNDRLTAVYNLASESGLAPDSIEPQREVADPLFTAVGLRLSGRGSYRNCVRFVQRLRKEMPQTTVAGIEMSGSPSSTEPTISFSFQLVWHASPASVASN
jgi:Tfp pilus assembly protein PilO